MGKERRKIDDHPADTGPEIPVDIANRRTVVIFVWIIGYFLAIWLLGFSIGGVLCTFIQLKFGSREKWFLSIIFSFIAWIVIYGAFDRLLHVPFPPGQLLVWLKIAT